MKKITTILLSFLVLISSTGMGIHIHKCNTNGEKIVHLNCLGHDSELECESNCETNSHQNDSCCENLCTHNKISCCTDTYSFIKSIDNLGLSKSNIHFNIFSIIIVSNSNLIINYVSKSYNNTYSIYKVPILKALSLGLLCIWKI